MKLVSACYSTREEARKAKARILHQNVGSDIVVWCDWNIRPTCDIRALVEQALDGYDIACSKHPVRDCVYDEARVCWMLKKANQMAIERQVSLYRGIVAPHSGLWELGVMFWRRTRQTESFGADWWEHMQDNTLRDQVSFPYCSRGLRINTLPHLFRGPGQTPFKIDESVRFA